MTGGGICVILANQFLMNDMDSTDKHKVSLRYVYEYASVDFPLWYNYKYNVGKQKAFLQYECEHVSSYVWQLQ